jgi:hypothetical protein
LIRLIVDPQALIYSNPRHPEQAGRQKTDFNK